VADGGWSGIEADGAQLRVTDGRCAAQVAVEAGVRDVALVDVSLPVPMPAPGAALAWSAAAGSSEAWQQAVPQWLSAAGFAPHRLADAPGLAVARTLAMLINEAADAVQQGVCTPDAADAAMKLGVNYPAGPFEWLAAWDAREVARLLDNLDALYRGERYRVSLELRRRAWASEG
jgi:3-hydroxybutyryl-CoA dehydrogenase